MQGLDTAVLLMACRDENDVIRIPNDESDLPGLRITIDSTSPITNQLKQTWLEKMEDKIQPEQIQILGSVEPLLHFDTYRRAWLLVMSTKDWTAPKEWMSLAQMLRSLKPGKNRVAYHKAVQLLAQDQDWQAVELDQAMQQRLVEIWENEVD